MLHQSGPLSRGLKVTLGGLGLSREESGGGPVVLWVIWAQISARTSCLLLCAQCYQSLWEIAEAVSLERGEKRQVNLVVLFVQASRSRFLF